MEEFFEVFDYYITYPKINRLIRTILLLLVTVGLGILMFVWFNTPMSVKFFPKYDPNCILYDNDGGPKKENFEAYVTMMSGKRVSVPVTGISYTQDEDTRDYYVTTSIADMVRTIRVTPIKVADVKAEYTGTDLRYGTQPSADNVQITVTYDDGHTKTLEKNAFTGALPNRIQEYTEVALSTAYGDTTLVLAPATITDLSIKYDVPDVCEGDLFDKRKVSADVRMDDGFERSLPNIEVYADDGMVIHGEQNIRVNTPYGEGTLVIKPYPLIDQTVEYTDVIFEGDILDPAKLVVTQTFDNGTADHFVRRTQRWSTDGMSSQKIEASRGMSFSIITTADTTEFTPTIVELDHVEMVQKDGAPLLVGTVPNPDYFIIRYSDGSSVDVYVEDVIKDGYSWENEANEGENWYSFDYNGHNYHFVTYGIKELPVKTAVGTFSDEFASSELNYISDNMYVAIISGTDGNTTYKLAHVVVNTPAQVKAGLSNDTYGGERETLTAAAKRKPEWIVGINASVFDYETGGLDRSIAKSIIKNGEIMPDSEEMCSGMETYLTSGAVFGSPYEGTSSEDLVNRGVTDTFASRDLVLIADGVPMNESVFSEAAPRTAIGMVRPGEYYLYVASGDGYSGGATYGQVRAVMWEHGCVYARCLDGGSSSVMVFKGDLVNTPAAGVERAVADYIYFVDVPADHTLSTYEYFSGIDGVEQRMDYTLSDEPGILDDEGNVIIG